MLLSIRDIKSKYRLYADGQEFGELRTFLIDTDLWVLRYLVVRVGSRDVLIGIRALEKPDGQNFALRLLMDRQKVINSPEININRRISREMERQIYDYYQWPYDWDADEVPESLPGDLSAVPLIEMELDREEQMVPQTGGANAFGHIFRTDDLFGHSIFTSNDNQNAGRLHDLVVSDQDWRIMYMVVDSNGFLPGGKKVALAPSWVEAIDESNARIIVNLAEDSIDNLPEYRSAEDLDL